MSSIPFSIWTLALSVALLTGPAHVSSAQTTNSTDQPVPLIQFQYVPFETAIENLSRQAGLNIIYTKPLPEELITLRLENVTAREVLVRLLTKQHLYLIENPTTTVALIATTNRVVSSVSPKWIAADTNNVIPLIKFQDVPLDVGIKGLAKSIGLQATVEPKIAPKIFLSIYWEKITARQALAALVESYNMTIEPDGSTNGIRIKAR